ncbi:unnamed protein product [Blepharisma stoltei]|uniref:Uncharacterized protein n=1 Tax=Blepharisma stoltei TaxID=1481888 RepID=A0AAU9ILC6_9CILI|nr:unnamed protein product [Blepharisma stoltei]
MEEWSYEICDCAKNPFMFVWSLCIPCGLHCMQTCNAKHADPLNKHSALRAYLCVLFFGCVGASINRNLLRKSLNIKGNLFHDFAHLIIPCCAVTQEWMQVMKVKKGSGELLITQLKVI